MAFDLEKRFSVFPLRLCLVLCAGLSAFALVRWQSSALLGAGGLARLCRAFRPRGKGRAERGSIALDRFWLPSGSEFSTAAPR